MSATIALCYRCDGQRARLYFHTCPGAYNDIGLIEFLEQLRRHFRGEQVLLLWDGLPSHRSGTMRAYLTRQYAWLRIEQLPAYAPDLNPVESAWSNLKSGALANRNDDTIEATVAAATVGVQGIRTDQDLLFSFLGQTGLTL
jgi:DDE superfamily endonuclease